MSNSITHKHLTPIAHARYTIECEFRGTADSKLATPSSPSCLYSTDGTYPSNACANSVTGTNGNDILTLTGAETNNKSLLIAITSSNCYTFEADITPYNGPVVSSGTLSAGSSTGGTLGTILAYDITGCYIRSTGGTGGGGTGGANNQARRILAYNVSTGVFACDTLETAFDGTTTYDVILPEGTTLGALKALNPATPGRTLVVDAAGLADANTVKVGPSGSGTAQTAKDLGATLGSPAGASLAADLAAVKTDTSSTQSIVSNGTYGNSALKTAINNIKNASWINCDIPDAIERPDSGSISVKFRFTFSDDTGAGIDPDASANPTITLVNNVGTDLSSRLSAWTKMMAGVWDITLTVDVSDALDALHFFTSGTFNGILRSRPDLMQIVDTTAVDFTISDRDNLDAALAKVTNLPSDPASEASVEAAITAAKNTLATDITNATNPLATETNATSNRNTLATDITNATSPLATHTDATTIEAAITALGSPMQDGSSVTVGTNNDKTGYTLSPSGVTAVQSGLATSGAQTTLQSTVSAIAAVLTGITSLGNWLRALIRSSAPDATALSEINTTGGTYNPTTMSLQYVAGHSGGGGSGGDAGLDDITDTETYPSGTLAGAVREIKAKTDMIVGGVVQFSNAVGPNLKVTAKRRHDFNSTAGNALTWPLKGNFRDLSGATIQFVAQPGPDARDAHGAQITGQINVSGVVDTASGANQQVHVDLTAADLTVTASPYWRYDLNAVYPDDPANVVVLASQIMDIQQDYAP